MAAEDAFSLELVDESEVEAPRKSTPQFTAPERREIKLAFTALCDSRDRISQRAHGKPATKISLVSREDFISKAIRRHGLEVLILSLGNRGDFGGETALSILSNVVTPFRSAQVKLGLDRDELKRLAEFDVSDEPRVTRTRPKLRL